VYRHAIGAALALGLVTSQTGEAQVYGYTNDKGVLILSNVPTNDQMRLIADGTPDEAGKTWHYSGQYDNLILKASSLHGVDSALVRAVIAVESRFNRYARSHKGARGLMQLMPDTARRYGVANSYDPWQNIKGGTAHLRDLLDEFKDLNLALAAYNAGPTPVRRYGTIPPYRETRDYVRKVLAIYHAGTRLQIVKGDKVYTIRRPGGETRVSTRPGAPDASTSSTLVALARRATFSRAGVAPKSAAPETAAQSASRASIEVPRELVGPVYFRFLDPEGVVHISRVRPASYPYEILDP
jgi:hypothetical protein